MLFIPLRETIGILGAKEEAANAGDAFHAARLQESRVALKR